MSDFRQQQEDEERALELLGAINRVAAGMGGRVEAEILASALGLGSTTVNKLGDTDEQ